MSHKTLSTIITCLFYTTIVKTTQYFLSHFLVTIAGVGIEPSPSLVSPKGMSLLRTSLYICVLTKSDKIGLEFHCLTFN